jgi:hypothetical protein
MTYVPYAAQVARIVDTAFCQTVAELIPDTEKPRSGSRTGIYIISGSWYEIYAYGQEYYALLSLIYHYADRMHTVHTTIAGLRASRSLLITNLRDLRP